MPDEAFNSHSPWRSHVQRSSETAPPGIPAAIAALRTGRAKTDGIITHRFALDDYGKALDALANDPTAHKVVLTA